MTHKDLLYIIDVLDIQGVSEGDFELEATSVDGNFIGEITCDNTDYLEKWSHKITLDYKEANFSLKVS